MKGYLMIAANTIKSTFTYRAHVFFQILASAFAIVIQFFLWRIIYTAIPGGIASGMIRGMSFNQTFLYVSLAAALGVLMRTWIDWEMNFQIRTGDIITFFFKPMDYMKYIFSNSMGSMAGNFITITIPSFIIIFGVFHTNLMFSWNIPFFLLTLTGSCLLSFLFDFIVGTTCFWTLSVWGISFSKDILISFLAGALLPLQFYPDAFVRVIRFFPFPYMYNLPLTIITSPVVDISVWVKSFAVQAIWIIALYGIARAYFALSMQKLTVNGG